MNRIYLLVFLTSISYSITAQELVGNKWVDNNLTLNVIYDGIKEDGSFIFCVLDTSRGTCIENLSTGVEVMVYDSEDKEIWKGKASGKTKDLKLPPLPQARYLIIKAFKPWVTNRYTGNRIHQEKAMETKHYIK